MGFSMGVGYALWVVRNRANDVEATVLFYGNGGGEYADTSTAFLGYFAEHDEFNNKRDVEALHERLQAGDGAVTFHTYPNTETLVLRVGSTGVRQGSLSVGLVTNGRVLPG